MEAELQRLELLIHHMGVSKEMATKAFLDAYKDYAEREGFDLEKGCMAIHRAVVPSLVEFDEAKEHIIIHDGNKFSINSVVFFTEDYLLDKG